MTVPTLQGGATGGSVRGSPRGFLDDWLWSQGSILRGDKAEVMHEHTCDRLSFYISPGWCKCVPVSSQQNLYKKRIKEIEKHAYMTIGKREWGLTDYL